MDSGSCKQYNQFITIQARDRDPLFTYTHELSVAQLQLHAAVFRPIEEMLTDVWISGI